MIRRILSWSLLSIGLIARAVSAAPTVPSPAKAAPAAEARAEARVEIAVFAMGCFWCGETQFEQQPGVISVISGYCGGAERNPTYEQVSAGVTGHYESVQVTFDPARTSYEKLLDLFWHGIDPTQGDGQFCDLGAQYRSVVFVANEAQRRAAEASKRELQRTGGLKAPIVTRILPTTRFWPAEEYHQDFYRKDPERYRSYRLGCGRDRRLRELWGDKASKPLVH